MIEAKQAVLFAQSKAKEILGADTSYLEEIERESDKGREVWSVTLSFPRRRGVSLNEGLGSIFNADPLQYKRFLIDAETGEFVAMRLRELALP